MAGKGISRRRFMGSAAAAGAAGAAGIGLFHIVPGRVLAAAARGAAPGTAPSEKLGIAFVGVARRGGANLKGLSGDGQEVVALCDVDAVNLANAAKAHPGAKCFRDYRAMLDDAVARSIDAVAVSTPDHTHAVVAMAAIRRRKHVYCEKPLAHSIAEVRALMAAARREKVVTQLGNQGHSSDSIRMFCEWVWDGALGNVREVHAGCAKVHSTIDKLGLLAERHEVPAQLDWDLWLGPARARAYHPMYCPGSWRNWRPFGGGAIGDWVCHVVDPVFWALDLGAPTSVMAEVRGEFDPKRHADTFAKGHRIRYEFAATAKRGPVTLYWHDGTDPIPRPEGLEEGRKVPDIGAVVIGDKASLTYGSHGAGGVRIFPESNMKAYARPAPSLPRVKLGQNGHHGDFLRAVRSGGTAGSDFAYGGPLTELALLGHVAQMFPGQELRWDGAAGRFTSPAAANALLQSEYRAGWTLEG